MKDEIKEILEALKPQDEEFTKAGIKEYPLVLNVKEQKTLLDYITNLQEKNEKVHKELDYADNYNIYLISKIDKAIEYILKLDKDYDINVYQEDKHWAMVLYILQGEDKDD